MSRQLNLITISVNFWLCYSSRHGRIEVTAHITLMTPKQLKDKHRIAREPFWLLEAVKWDHSFKSVEYQAKLIWTELLLLLAFTVLVMENIRMVRYFCYALAVYAIH